LSKVDEAKREIYFTGTGPDPLGGHLFRVRLDGTRLMQVTSGEGHSHCFGFAPADHGLLIPGAASVIPEASI
jgi:hypothetical protein